MNSEIDGGNFLRIRKISGQFYNGRSIAAGFTGSHVWLLDHRLKESCAEMVNSKTLAATVVTCFTGRRSGDSGSYVM